MNLTIDSSQIDALREFFEGLSTADQRKIFIAAFRRAAKPIVADAKSTVPRRTGNLANSIGTVDVRGETAILIGAKKGGGSKGWHGHLIENGTVQRFRKKKNNAPTGRIIGTKFFEMAYMKNEDYLAESTEEEWMSAIDRMIVRINKKAV